METIPLRSIVLFQHCIFCERHQRGSLGELRAFCGTSFGNEKTGSRAHVINEPDDAEEYGKDGEDQQCAVDGPHHEYQADHNGVDRHEA